MPSSKSFRGQYISTGVCSGFSSFTEKYANNTQAVYDAMKIKTCHRPCKYGKLIEDQASQNKRSLSQHVTASNHTAAHRTPKR